MTSKQEQLKEYYFKKQKLEKELSELKINLRKAKIKVYDLENNVILKFIYNDFKLKKEKQEMMRLQTQMNTREEELKLLNDKIEYLNNYKEKEHIQNFELEEKLNNLFLKQKEIKKSLKKYKNGLTLCKDAKDYIQEAYFHASAAIDPRLGVFPIIWKNEALDKAQESLSLVKEYIKDVDIQLVDPLLQAIQGKYDSIISYMTTIEEMFAPYGGIN